MHRTHFPFVSLVLLALLWLTGIPGNAQPSPVDNLLEKLGNFAQQYPAEKVYLHLDKPYYTVGDDIWFKAYVTLGPYNSLSGLSKILYVDLIGPTDRIVQSVRLPLIAGLTMGDFHLADSLTEGNYRIRAYTNWMRNFDPDMFYDRILPIGNARTDQIVTHSSFWFENSPVHTVKAEIAFTDLTGGPMSGMDVQFEINMESRNISRGKRKTDAQGRINFDFVNKQPFNLKTGEIILRIKTPDDRWVSKIIPLKTTANTNSVRFFAESGHLIAGNTSRVAFKAVRPTGLGIGASGYIEDDMGRRVAEFESAHTGLGSFNFVPDLGRVYTAHVTFADGSQGSERLPTVQASGYALAVNNDLDRQVYVQAYASDDLVDGQELSLILQHGGEVFYASKSKLTKKELVFSVPREHLPGGVIQITLFDSTMNPLAERVIFNNSERSLLPLQISTDKKTYRPRQRVTVRLAAGWESDSSRIAAFSASVIDLEKVPVDSSTLENNILSSLLLSSDVRGYIESPSYYFEDQNITKRRHLDLVMLTHDWSKINWQDLTAGKMPIINYAAEQALRISGLVTRRDGRTPVPNARVTILSTGNVAAVIDTITGSDGRFAFDRLLFYDNNRFVVQARDEKGKKNVDIHLDEWPRQQVTRTHNAPDATIDVNQSINTYLRNTQEQFTEMEKYGLKEKTILLEEVKVTREAVKNNVRYSSNLNGPGNADQVITAEDLSRGCNTLEMCLQGRLVGVIFRNGIPYSTRSPGMPMQIVLDGMYMEPEALSYINPFDVETIEVLRNVSNTAIYGSRGSGGLLIITTKRGDGGSFGRDLYTPGIVTHSTQGYYEVREFYVQDYENPTDSLDGMIDLRTTIHWEPNIVTDTNGSASFSFFTADNPGRYRIVVEGLDVNGRLGRAVHYITVE